MKWNEVTWYSRLGAIILFVGVLPVLSFTIGMQFEKLQSTALVLPIVIVEKNPSEKMQVITKDEEILVVPPVVAESWGSIYGTVLLGPVCPVVQFPADEHCADRPFETKLALVSLDGTRVIKEFSSNAQGKFNVDVQPGSYSVRSAANANILPSCSSREAIVVPINDSVQADVFCDSGIR